MVNFFKTKQNSLILGLFIVSLLIFSSCSSKPDIDDLKADIEEQIKNESNGSIELISLEKTNETNEEFLGQKSLKIFYKVKIKFTRECYLYVDRSGRGPLLFNFKTFDQKPDLMPGGIGHVLSKAAKGEVLDYSGLVMYVKTDEGWVKQIPPSIY